MNDRFERMEELRRHWAPPPGLAASTPRLVVLSGLGIVMVVLAGLVFLGAVAASIGLETVARRHANENRQLREQGLQADARVTRHWRNRNKENHPMVDYEFAWEGRTYTGRSRVPLHVWRKLDVGSPFPVRFVPANPGRNRARDWGSSGIPRWLPFGVGAVLAGVGTLMVYFVRREARLLREGRAAPGMITKYSPATHDQQTVHYEFQLMSGNIGKGQSGPGRSVPAIGTAVTVVYDRDNPRRNAVYPMGMVRLAAAPAPRGRRDSPKKV